MLLIDKTKKFIQEHGLFKTGERVIVGVSGGPDSVVLLIILNQLRSNLGLQLHVAHFNHQLRPGAGADERFVEDLAAKLNLPFHTGRWKKSSRPIKGSIEDLARQARLKFLIDLAKRLKATSITLGHHQDDLAETVLMRIVRGSGLQGMRAILPSRIIDGVKVVRPLLALSKREISHYLLNNRLKFQSDPTNRQTQYFRNKIRLKLLPLLEKEYNKNIRSVLATLAESVALDYEFLEDHMNRMFSTTARTKGKTIRFSLTSLKKVHPAARRMLFRLSIKKLQGSTNRITAGHLKEIEDMLLYQPAGSITALPAGIRVGKEKNNIVFKLSLE